ncbi:hypothetical protein GCM10027049_30560 [Mucilaginibacter puniceus]
MSKKAKHIDSIYLAILVCISLISIYRYLNDDYTLSVNNYAAFILLICVINYKVAFPNKGKYLVLGLLALSTLNIINFTIEVFRVKVGVINEGANFDGIGFNLILFVLLISYSIINKDIIKSIFSYTNAEAADNENKMIAFYYEKFMKTDDDTFDTALSNINEYPYEAQIALRKIKEEKDI